MTLWQGLGAFCANAPNLGSDALDRFQAAGGSWICFVLYNDSANAEHNQDVMPTMKAELAKRGIAACGWYNYFGDDPETFADDTCNLHKAWGLTLAIFDCEDAVVGNTKLARLTKEIAKRFLPNTVGISTNQLNDSVVWNGRIEGEAPGLWLSAHALGIRVLPQWYIAPRYAGSTWTDPVANMKWLSGPGGTSDNLLDSKAKNKRAVPLSYVHGTGEVTGLEDADLDMFLGRCKLAQQYGLTKGISLYLIENAPASDFDLVNRYRGDLYVPRG